MTTRTRRERDERRATTAPRPTVAMAPPLAAATGSESPLLAQARPGPGSGAVPDAPVDFEARCAQLEDENRRLKLLVADLSLRNEALKLVVAKKW